MAKLPQSAPRENFGYEEPKKNPPVASQDYVKNVVPGETMKKEDDYNSYFGKR